MSKVRLYGDTSGFVDLKAPDVASNVTITLPNTAGLFAAEAYVDSAVSGLASESYVDTQVATKAPLLFTENVQTGNYTLALSDVAKVVAINNGSAATVTVPPNSSVAFEVGTVVNVYAMTANTVTVSGGSGVTVRNAGDIADQYVEVSLRKRATNEWVLSGQVA